MTEKSKSKSVGMWNIIKFTTKLIRYWWVIIAVVLVVGLAFIYKGFQENPPVQLKVVRNTSIDISPEEIRSIRDIGQWEFLSVSTEELIEWHRHRTFGNDHLVRIYSGTLRIGIDMDDIKGEWFTSLPDSTAHLKLPAVKLLDNQFIDETRTRSFYQKGTIPSAVLDELYEKARVAMIKRCITKQNLNLADKQAREHFTRIFKSLGFKKVEIEMPHPQVAR